jgi:hypothetical protein
LNGGDDDNRCKSPSEITDATMCCPPRVVTLAAAMTGE